MSEEIRINRPSQPQNQTRQDYAGQPTVAAQQERSKTGSKLPWIVLAVVVVILIAGAILFRDKLFGGAKSAPASGEASGYQAVFLTNGQVYFGKLSDADGSYVDLKDIYYLQVVQPPLQGQQQPGQATSSAQQQPQISLIKLGNELHGPMDEMHISRAQILFYEDLKSSGQVVQAILKDQASAASNK